MKIDFTDVTFTIPIRFDSEDRVFNFKHNIKFLRDNFDTNIMVFESDSISHEDLIKSVCPDIKYMFEQRSDGIFHRTKYLNDMCRAATTTIVVNYDVDVFLPVEQCLAAREVILQGRGFCMPYDGRVFTIRRDQIYDIIVDGKVRTDFDGPTLFGSGSLGGVVFVDKEKYRSVGWENENFISWGPEDSERAMRVNVMGLGYVRVDGPLYHIDHVRLNNSSQTNPLFVHNNNEHAKIAAMTKEELQSYISTWPWIQV